MPSRRAPETPGSCSKRYTADGTISGEADYKYVSRLRQVRLYNGLSPHLVGCGLERTRQAQMMARKCQEGLFHGYVNRT